MGPFWSCLQRQSTKSDDKMSQLLREAFCKKPIEKTYLFGLLPNGKRQSTQVLKQFCANCGKFFALIPVFKNQIDRKIW